jgi:hypothetical protein
MQRPLTTRRRGLAIAMALAASLGATPTATAADQTAAGCAAQFEIAQRTDMESFRDFDEETFRAGHDPRAVTIFASGAVRFGIDAIMTALHPHFVNRNAVWSFTELYRVVDGCKSAFILYDTNYDIPSIGYHQRTLTGVTYTHDGNRWLSIADQGTYPRRPGLRRTGSCPVAADRRRAAGPKAPTPGAGQEHFSIAIASRISL